MLVLGLYAALRVLLQDLRLVCEMKSRQGFVVPSSSGGLARFGEMRGSTARYGSA